jgi:Cu/Ag efflux pump CusA
MNDYLLDYNLSVAVGVGFIALAGVAAGGMVSATILTLAVIPAVFILWQEWILNKKSSGTGK